MAMEFEGMSFMPDDFAEALFTGNGEEEQPKDGGTQQPPKETEDDPNGNGNTAEETTVDPETLFAETEETPESVGGKDNKGKREDAPSSRSIPPFSSLAKALKEDGIFLDLEDSDIENANDAESFSALIEKTIQSRLDERQRRIDEALNNGVQPSLINQYENTLHQLDSITDEQVGAESEQGENLRRQILMRDYLNRGFKQDRAQREVERIFNSGTDIDDAKEALESIKQTVRDQYQDALDDAKRQEEEVKNARTQQAAAIRKGLLEDKEVFGDLEVSKDMRQKALDAIVKPIYQDPKTGEKYTAIQKFEMDNRVEFLKKLGLVFAMTDGFKSLDGLVKGKVKKEVGKGMKALEEKLNNTQRKADGSLDFVGPSDSESFLGFTLDV